MTLHLMLKIGITKKKKRPSLERQKGKHFEEKLGFTRILVIKYIPLTLPLLFLVQLSVSLKLVLFSQMPFSQRFNGYSQNWVS